MPGFTPGPLGDIEHPEYGIDCSLFPDPFSPLCFRQLSLAFCPCNGGPGQHLVIPHLLPDLCSTPVCRALLEVVLGFLQTSCHAPLLSRLSFEYICGNKPEPWMWPCAVPRVLLVNQFCFQQGFSCCPALGCKRVGISILGV